jgi:hypothetical protein
MNLVGFRRVGFMIEQLFVRVSSAGRLMHPGVAASGVGGEGAR